mgnify:CR=1 FL=1
MKKRGNIINVCLFIMKLGNRLEELKIQYIF